MVHQVEFPIGPNVENGKPFSISEFFNCNGSEGKEQVEIDSPTIREGNR